MFIHIAIGIATVAALLKLLTKPWPKRVYDPNMPEAVCSLPADDPEPRSRTSSSRVSYGTEPGATVRGWPPKGGF
jgi:hypothetical protein